MKNGVSVLLCCYNSGWILERTLKNLLLQETDGVEWEIIVVDNNSSDETSKIAEKVLSSSLEIPYRVVLEKRPGVLFARLTGMLAANFSYIVYCDDDNLLDVHYVKNMYDYMEQHPQVGACGGRGVPEFLAEPDSIIRKNLMCYAMGSQRDNVKNYNLFGAGTCLRTSVAKDITMNHHFYLVGRCGSQLLAGEDSEIMKCIVLKGFQLANLDGCTFIHVLPERRLNRKYLYKLYYGLGMSNPIQSIYDSVIKKKSVFYVYRALVSSIKNNIHYLFIRNKSDDQILMHLLDKGFIVGTFHFGLFRLARIYAQIKKEFNYRFF